MSRGFVSSNSSLYTSRAATVDMSLSGLDVGKICESLPDHEGQANRGG
jgi:hypothetical protein